MKNVYLLLALLFAGCTVEQELITDAPTGVGEEVIVINTAVNSCEECIASEFGLEQEPDTAFNFSNGKRLLICGYYESLNGIKVFSEFVLSECGDSDIIDYWDAIDRYEVEFNQDTLKLHKLERLALGHNREFVNAPWFTEYFYYKGNRIKRDVKFNTAIKYNQKQISETLRDYENAEWLDQNATSEEYEAERMILANRLMLASVSGSHKAEKYLKELNRKIRASGVDTQWYDNLLALHKTAKREW